MPKNVSCGATASIGRARCDHRALLGGVVILVGLPLQITLCFQFQNLHRSAVFRFPHLTLDVASARRFTVTRTLHASRDPSAGFRREVERVQWSHLDLTAGTCGVRNKSV